VPTAATLRAKVRRPPATRFSAAVSAHRVVELISLPLADIKEIRRRIEGATVNDIFLATVGGALNAYLGAKGELPDRTMTAQVPMSLRGEDKGGDRGNQVGVVVMPIHSEIGDPLKRLAAIRLGAGKAKALVAAVGKDLTQHVYDLLPAVASELFTTKVMLPTMNVIVSNVRGPDVPIYLAGARMVAFAPVSIALNGLGLNVTGFSYDGRLWVCAVACREMMPDPAVFADCLRQAFGDLVAAAAALPRQDAKPESSTRRAGTKASGAKSRGRKSAAPGKAGGGRKSATQGPRASARRGTRRTGRTR
jgi:WS/DGAT/MGAT family acyltransferase